MESQDLLSLTLKYVQGLSKVKLQDASFIWTEPHSRRIKVSWTEFCSIKEAPLEPRLFITWMSDMAVTLWGCESLQIRVNAKKEVMHGVDVSQKVDMEFVVKTMQCEDCTRSFTEQTWKALVQVSVSQLGTAGPDIFDLFNFDRPHIYQICSQVESTIAAISRVVWSFLKFAICACRCGSAWSTRRHFSSLSNFC